MLKAHLGIDYAPLLRSKLDGLPPSEASRYFQGLNKLRRGVLSHVVFPAIVERSIARRERDRMPAKQRRGGRHSKAMVVGLVQSLRATTSRLAWQIQHTAWSRYETTHSYAGEDFQIKEDFVQRHVGSRPRRSVWDIGCNTGAFSRIATPYSEVVVALDGDHDAIEQLYRSQKSEQSTRIVPLVMDLANVSPNQGWAGVERKSLDARCKPDIVLCLALIHHLRVSSNVPLPHFLDWLRSLKSEVILEFVGRQDEMFVKLLANKTIAYEDYALETFLTEASSRYEIRDRTVLKDGHRELFFLVPR
jgi:SAM-dependent methyltransferase